MPKNISCALKRPIVCRHMRVPRQLSMVFFLCLTLILLSAQAQSIITTVAGSDFLFPRDPIPALQAPLGEVDKVLLAPDGSVIAADEDNSIVVRIESDGTLRIVAGNGTFGITGDGGPATAASLGAPFGLALDHAGNLYFSERFGCVRKVNPGGIISTVSCLFSMPVGLAIDSKDNLYVAAAGSHQIARVTPDGVISVVAGTGTSGFSGDGGPAVKAMLNSPLALAIDSQDNLYVTEPLNNRVREITASGTIFTVAGGGTSAADSIPATAAALTPLDVALDAQGNIYITDFTSAGVKKITPDGIATRIAGTGKQTFDGDGGPALQASFTTPGGIFVDPSGNIHVSDRGAHRVRLIDASTNHIQTIAGNGKFRFSDDGVKAATAILAGPDGIVADRTGNVYFSDGLSNRVRKISPDGLLTTVAGTGEAASSGDGGPAKEAKIATPAGLALDAQGNLLIVDSVGARIRRVGADGVITTIAGNGLNGYDGDNGLATNARLAIPTGVAVGPDGSVYIADPQNRRVRRVFNRIITTFAGNGTPGASGAIGDNGPATQASTPYPFDVAVDPSGNVYISDYDRIRRVDTDGTITTFADPSVIGCCPNRLTTDADGNVLASVGNRIIKITPDGVPALIAGNGAAAFGGDGGPATAASLVCSCGVALGPSGYIYLTDQGNNRVRVILPVAPQLSVSTANIQLSGRSTGAPTPTQAVTVSSSISGVPFTATTSTVQGGNWLTVTPNRATTPSNLQISGDPSQLTRGTYNGTITISSESSGTAAVIISVKFIVADPQPAKLLVNSTLLSFSFLQGASASAQTLLIANSGDGELNFTATASTSSRGNWLSVMPTNSTATAAQAAPVTVSADPGNLNPGTYTGQVVITNRADAGDSTVLAVTMIVSAIQRKLLLSQYGLTFTIVEQGPQAPSQTFGVLNIGQGMMAWTVQTVVFSSGANWLSATPSSGSTDASSLTVPTVEVAASPTGLAKGTYYGEVLVSAPDADNSPQVVSIVLNVLPAGSNPGLLVRPTGLIFTSVAGRQPPGSQSVEITNLSTIPVSFIAGHLPADPDDRFKEFPSNGTLLPGVPFTLQVVPSKPILQPGVLRGTLTIQPDDLRFSPQVVDVLQVVVPAPGGSGSIAKRESDGQACTPSTLFPVFTQANANNVVAAWPNALEVRVVDSCAGPLTAGRVVVSFSNGDPQLNLASLKDGRWAGTWTPRKSLSQVTLTVNAATLDQRAAGSAVFMVNGVQSNNDPPVVQPGSVLNAADPSAVGAPLAPGSEISIFGVHLADSTSSVAEPPFETELMGTSVLLGTVSLPISAVTRNRIDAVIPFDVPVNVSQQILVLRNGTLSAPEQVVLSSAQPAIFSSDSTGTGQGLVYRVATDGTLALAGPGNPASIADTIAIRCTGLGSVNQAVSADLPAPSSPPAAVNGVVSARIGGVDVAADSAFLVPGKAGLYEVRVTIPTGVPTGDQIAVSISVNDHTSSTVTMSIQ